jgi:hypothetical protein
MVEMGWSSASSAPRCTICLHYAMTISAVAIVADVKYNITLDNNRHNYDIFEFFDLLVK